MLTFTLPFGGFREIEPNVIEATIFDGVEMDRNKVDQVLSRLNESCRGPYVVLSNRVNRYSHTHESMQALAEEKRLKGMAVLVYRPISCIAASIHELYQRNVKVFREREASLEWLRQTLALEAEDRRSARFEPRLRSILL